jgi:TetR/AcrR family transcriptional regulator
VAGRRVDTVAPGPRRRGRPRNDARPPGAPTTKELIVRAAADAFASRGFDGANLVDIAAAAGVTTGAVYSHFRGKPELLLTVMTSTLEAVHPLRRADHDLTPQYLHEWVAWLIAPGQVNLRALIAEIHHAAMRDPEVRGLLGAYGSQYASMIAEMVAGWQDEGLVASDRNPRAVAQVFLTQALGLCTTGAFRPEMLRDLRVTALFDQQLAALLGELETGGTPA